MVGREDLNEVQIHRWDGGQAWTEVDSAGALNVVGSLLPWMEADTEMLAYSFDNFAGTRTLRATADGVTWADQTTTQPYPEGLYYSDQIDKVVCQARNYGVSDDMDERDTDGSWPALNPVPFTDTAITLPKFLGTGDGKQFFRTGTGPGFTVSHSTDWGTNKTNIVGTWRADYPSIYEYSGRTWAAGLRTTAGSLDQIREWNSGTSTFDLDGTPQAGVRIEQRLIFYAGYMYVVYRDGNIYARDDAVGPVAVKDYVIGAGPQPMDVSADDVYLYVGTLQGGNPVLLRLLSTLVADPTQAYAPGAGSVINVRCGDKNTDWVWIAGDFGVPMVRLSIDDGATWTTKDPGTWAGVAQPIVVGPDSDDLVLVATDGDDDLHETEDGGLIWTTLNAALPFDIGGMDRLDVNPNEMVFGSDADRNTRYTPNRGVTLHDITNGLLPNVAITEIVVG
jgi:hypothetical protein